jgi:putative phosphoribosyl transferase
LQARHQEDLVENEPIEQATSMDNLIEDVGLKGKKRVFADREDAGRRLASLLEGLADPKGMVLAIPSGGVPVACAVARAHRLLLDVLTVRKIQIPDNPEAGFGAIGPTGEVLLNERIVDDLRLSPKEIQAQVAETLRVLEAREKVFRKGRPRPELRDRQVILVDDGLASGYTMMAAIGFARQKEARQVIVAVPTASQRSIHFLQPATDVLVCPNVRGGPVFAVADAYKEWYDLGDEEVIQLLEGSRAGGQGSGPVP